jgi:hypothetical protein
MDIVLHKVAILCVLVNLVSQVLDVKLEIHAHQIRYETIMLKLFH